MNSSFKKPYIALEWKNDHGFTSKEIIRKNDIIKVFLESGDEKILFIDTFIHGGKQTYQIAVHGEKSYIRDLYSKLIEWLNCNHCQINKDSYEVQD